MSVSYPDIDLAQWIDHTLLDPLATPEAIAELCDQADRLHFPTVCVYPTHVKQAVEFLYRKTPKVSTVIGFPSGAATSAVKYYEAQDALENGAQELDVVIDLSGLVQGKVDRVHDDLANICALSDVPVKAILEMALLSDVQKRLGAEICMDAGAAFLKTSTGWRGGATVEDVKLLKEVTRDRIGIKASGGIRTVDQALALILAGAARLGTSHGVALMRMRETSSSPWND